MLFELRALRRRRQWGSWSGFLVFVASIGLAVARPGPASGAAFQRGDVLLTGSGSVQEYSPSGQLQQTISGTSGAVQLCLDPSGKHLILPGVGLFDSSGRLVSSKWSSIAAVYDVRCVADGLGDVYVSAPAVQQGSTWPIMKYDIQGDLLQTFSVAAYANTLEADGIDLAPDECTMYYGSWNGGAPSEVGRFNVCTNTQEPPFVSYSFTDDLRVLPNWSMIVTTDWGGSLWDASGDLVQSYRPPDYTVGTTLRSMSLDPDGTSFWMGGGLGVARYDIGSGQMLSLWCTDSPLCTAVPATGPIAVYSPPLVGDADVAPTFDSDTAGTAKAFATRAGYTGQLSQLHLYVDSSSTASQVIVGIYSDRDGHPGALKSHATITNARPGSWTYVTVPALSITAKRRYWIAVLAPKGAGTLSFTDTVGGAASETSASQTLTRLPGQWSTGTVSTSGPLSAYGT
jgi:hypothetical protein